MMSLFSSFDLYFFAAGSIIWISAPLLMMKSIFTTNKKDFLTSFIFMKMNIFFFSLKYKSFTKMTLVMVLSLFSSILISNSMSITPYFFSLTSQISMVLFISLSMWTGFTLIQLAKSSKNFISHLTPAGTPHLLVPFLFLIEIISSIIRPLTVSIRLVANILAGHLLMILLSKVALTTLPVTLLYAFLNMIELAVALIQSYIFCTMLTLYYSEIA